MTTYIIKRILLAIPVLFGVLTAVFLLVHIVPGDPAHVILGMRATPEMLQQVRQELGLDQPLYVQYYKFASNYLTGQMGESYLTGRLVIQEIAARFPHTIYLAVGGTIISVLVGVPAGVISAVKKGSVTDQIVMVLAMIGVTAPGFVIALVLIYVFSLKLGWFPTIGGGDLSNPLEVIHHTILPAIALGLPTGALIARMTRSSMLEVLNKDYIRTARAKGLSEQVVVYKHALRNAALPIVTIVGLNFGDLIGSAVVVSAVFARPGLGKRLMYAVFSRDYPVIQGITFIVAAAFIFVNLAVDIFYGVLDPRVRYD